MKINIVVILVKISGNETKEIYWNFEHNSIAFVWEIISRSNESVITLIFLVTIYVNFVVNWGVLNDIIVLDVIRKPQNWQINKVTVYLLSKIVHCFSNVMILTNWIVGVHFFFVFLGVIVVMYYTAIIVLEVLKKVVYEDIHVIDDIVQNFEKNNHSIRTIIGHLSTIVKTV